MAERSDFENETIFRRFSTLLNRPVEVPISNLYEGVGQKII